MIRRLWPHPFSSAIVLLTWMELTDLTSPGHWVIAGVLAWALPYATRKIFLERIRLRNLHKLPPYILLVAFDVVVSSAQVCAAILLHGRDVKSALVKVPLDIRDPFGITALAATVSYTPGTVSADVSEDRTHLLVHIVHTDDPAAVVREIKSRYEARLLEMFEC